MVYEKRLKLEAERTGLLSTDTIGDFSEDQSDYLIEGVINGIVNSSFRSYREPNFEYDYDGFTHNRKRIVLASLVSFDKKVVLSLSYTAPQSHRGYNFYQGAMINGDLRYFPVNESEEFFLKTFFHD